MKAIVLAGGFAKRLWPLTLDKAKPLLEIAGKPMINYIIEKLGGIGGIDEIFVSTNERFRQDFRQWLKKYKFKKIKIVIEKTRNEGEKLGAIAGISFVLEKEKIDDDCIIIAGDNLFGFTIPEFIGFYKEKKYPVVALFDVGNYEKAKQYGIAKIDENGIIRKFLEKPEKPPSTLASTCCYIFPRKTVKLFPEYIKEDNLKDAPGFFLQWLIRREKVFAFVFSSYWFDVGSFESLEEAKKFMSKR
jgi:glucose-1-phosphate thymidylyltransferase